MASQYGRLEVAQLLPDHGTDVNATTRDYNTALHFTSLSNYKYDWDAVVSQSCFRALENTTRGHCTVQTNSLLSPPIASQGTPTPYSTSAPSLEISADAPVSVSAPPGPGPAPGTQFAAGAAGPIVPAPTPVSSYGGLAPVPLRGTARVTHSYPALPEASNPPLRPILMPGGDVYRPSTAPYADGETAWQAHDDRDPYREIRLAHD